MKALNLKKKDLADLMGINSSRSNKNAL
jgi:hypothetical protein